MARPQLKPGTMGKVTPRERNGRFQGRASARTLGGELVHLTASGASKAEVMEDLHRQLRALSAYSGDRLHENSTIGEAIDRWLANRRAAVATGALKKQSYAQYVINSKEVVKRIGAVPLREAGPALLFPFLEQLVETAAPKSVSPDGDRVAGTMSLARNTRIVLRGAFATAVAHEVITHNPLAEHKLPKKQKVDRRALTPAQFVAMRESIMAWGANPRRRSDWQRLLDILDVSMGTSMRVGEVLALRPADIDFDVEETPKKKSSKKGKKAKPTPQTRVYVTGTIVEVNGKLLRQPEPKRDRQERAMNVPRATEDVLRRRSAGLATGALLFGTRTGEPYGNPDRLLVSWRTSPEGQAWMELCSLTAAQVTYKLMRRSAATRTRDKLGIEAAGGLLGHSFTSTTEGSYTTMAQVDRRTGKALEGMWG